MKYKSWCSILSIFDVLFYQYSYKVKIIKYIVQNKVFDREDLALDLKIKRSKIDKFLKILLDKKIITYSPSTQKFCVEAGFLKKLLRSKNETHRIRTSKKRL